MPNLMILTASTRPGRQGPAFARWFAELTREHTAFDLDLADLLEIDLPFLDEPNHPRLRQYTQGHTKAWSARVSAADAFVFVTPEYNYGIPAPLKNAIDFLHHEWAHKPVGFVSYGGVSAGTRGVQMTKQVVTTLNMMPVSAAVSVPFFPQFIRGDGEVEANQQMVDGALTMLADLERWETQLRALRV